jgi:hypothetical protein
MHIQSTHFHSIFFKKLLPLSKAANETDRNESPISTNRKQMQIYGPL